MVGASLLNSDDDSDVPDLDLRGSIPRRRHFFNKNSTNDYEEIRHRRKTYKTILFISFSVSFLIGMYFLYSSISRIRVLTDEVKELQTSLKSVEEVQTELKRIRMEFEIIREMESSGNETKGTTGMIYDKLAAISGKFDTLWSGFRKNSATMEDVTSRMSRVENKCLAVCQVGGAPRGREQPRRAAEKKRVATSGDEIVFRRNE